MPPTLLAAVVLLLAPITFASSPAPPTDPGAPAPSIDLRPVFDNWGLHTRAQGGRGTCSAFVVTEALEYALATQRRAGTALSVEFLNWASNDATKDSADGGFFSDLWSGFTAHGICTLDDMPYHDAFDPALRPSSSALEHALALRNAGLQLHWIKPWDVTTGLTDEHVGEIKRTLGRQWPVCAGLRWPKVERWNGNVLEMAPPEGVRDGHSVLLVGFRDDSSQAGGGVFIFRNSNRPAQDGEMTYEYARAYMNDAVWIDFDLTTAAPGAGVPAYPAFLSPLSPAPAGRNHRVSSNQQPDWHSENLDMTWLQPGQSIEMPLLSGPGVITHMWFTSHAGWANELNALSLRIYWDGSADPGVEAPLGDFFAVGQGKPAVVESIPVQVSFTGALTCYWRMPFRQSARIVVTNDNPDRGAGLYWQVDWTQLDQLGADTPYFHARYRQEYPARAGQDYTFADLHGRGWYVGTVMSVTMAQDGWFGEGDDFFYVDGEDIPSLQGTGTEDYFNDAWGFRARTSHWFGTPRWQGDSAGDSGVCYRWHLPDPVFFTSSLKATIEHKGNHAVDTEGFFVERPEFLSSVAFWYQDGEPKDLPPLAAWKERRIPWEHHHFVRAFRRAEIPGDTKISVDTTGLFGARPVVLWPNTTAGAVLLFPFEIADDGRYALRLTAGSGPEFGTYDIDIDSEKITTGHFKAPESAELDLLLGTRTLAKGLHTIAFRAVGNRAEPAAPLTIEMLRTLRLPPEAKRSVRTHHEAHFVRLGIGRAVYAYRMVYDKLPDSLDTLVKSGMMPARYLKNENDEPLQSRIDGDFFVVESKGAEPWTHRWQGLDARR